MIKNQGHCLLKISLIFQLGEGAEFDDLPDEAEDTRRVWRVSENAAFWVKKKNVGIIMLTLGF